MKLATLKSKSRDGILCLVDQKLTRFVKVDDLAPNLQTALENWVSIEQSLKERYQALNENQLKNTESFDATLMSAPLPRAYQWLDGSAYLNHVELVRKARGASMPEKLYSDPLMYQGGSDAFIGPQDPIFVADEAFGIDFEAEMAVITDDVPMGVSVKEASKHIKLILLVNDVSLRNLIPDELAKGFGFLQSKPASSFAPIAITTDELGHAWDGERVHINLRSILNGTLFGEPDTGIEMNFSFPTLIAHAAKTRSLIAGTIIGSGTVSNKDERKGSSCIAEKRMLEIIASGTAKTPFMRFGDRIQIEALDTQGFNIFGTIDQVIKPYEAKS